MKLVVVESPAKAKTLKGYLTSEYEVVASIGHFRDLPKSGMGIEIIILMLKNGKLIVRKSILF